MKLHKAFTFALSLAGLCAVFAGDAPHNAIAAQVSKVSDAAAVAEVRKSFTIGGKPIPPEIFRDFGDGDIADSGAIWITVDAAAAIGSNLYFDDVKRTGSYVSQTKRGPNNVIQETTDYTFYGTTQNGLIVVIASYNSGGTGIFYTLHLVDVAAARGIDLDGKRYRRIDLSNVRSVILGDRWEGNRRSWATKSTSSPAEKGRPTVARNRRRRSRQHDPERAARRPGVMASVRTAQ